MLNCYHNNDGNLYGVGKEMSLIAENCHYEVPGNDVFRGGEDTTGFQGIGNIGSADGMNDSEGTVFTIPYSYSAMPASEVEAAVTDPDSGAGNTCIFQP
jgi:pectate lyase